MFVTERLMLNYTNASDVAVFFFQLNSYHEWLFTNNLRSFHARSKTSLADRPCWNGEEEVSYYRLYLAVSERGGYKQVIWSSATPIGLMAHGPLVVFTHNPTCMLCR